MIITDIRNNSPNTNLTTRDSACEGSNRNIESRVILYQEVVIRTIRSTEATNSACINIIDIYKDINISSNTKINGSNRDSTRKSSRLLNACGMNERTRRDFNTLDNIGSNNSRTLSRGSIREID